MSHRVITGGVVALALAAMGGVAFWSSDGVDAAAEQGDAFADGEARYGAVLAALQASPNAQMAAEWELVAPFEADVLKPLTGALRTGDVAAWSGRFVDGGSDVAWASASQGEGAREVGPGLEGVDWVVAAAAPGAEVGAWLASLGQVRFAALHVTDMQATADGASFGISMDVRGERADGVRRHDRGQLRADAVRTASGFLLRGLVVEAMETVRTLEGREPAFADVTSAMGMGHLPVIARSEAIRRGGYALVTEDMNGDGRADLLVGDAGPVKLFRQTDAGFVDVSEAVGLRGERSVKSAAVADLDGDGLKDIVLLRFVTDGTDTLYKTMRDAHAMVDMKVPDATGEIVAYRGQADGTFAYLGDILPRGYAYDRAMPLVLADFDVDGRLDIYVGFPGVRDFTNALAEGDRPEKLASQGLWLNQGGFRFDEAPQRPDDFRSHTDVYPHAALATDLDGDHLPDLLVVDDSGRQNTVYLNDGQGGFVRAETGLGLAQAGWSMGMVAGDLDGDGDLDVFTSNLDLRADRRRLASLGQGSIAAVRQTLGPSYPIQDNGLWRNDGGTYADVAPQAGVAFAGAGAAVPQLLDYDADGLLDVYLPAGLWSGGDVDFERVFLDAASRGQEFQDPLVAGPGAKVANPALQVLREATGTGVKAGEGLLPALSFAGYEPNRLLRNNGDGTFTDVAFLEGADLIEDGYVAATVDLDADGRQDLVLRHCDPAPGRPYNPVSMLRNQLPERSSVTVRVAGVSSNPDGVGALLTAEVAGRRLVRDIQGVAGAVQSEGVAFFGLGDADKLDRLEVRFPSGAVRVFTDVPAGRVVVREDAAEVEVARR